MVRTGGSYSAFILEVFSKQQDGRAGTAAIAKAVVGDVLHDRLLPVSGFEGAAILYDVGYHYAQGRRYRGAQAPLLGERLRIGGKSQAAKPSLMTGVSKTSDGGCGLDCFSFTFAGGPEQCDCPGQIVVTGDLPPSDGGGPISTGPGDDGGGWSGVPADTPPGSGGGGDGSTGTVSVGKFRINPAYETLAPKLIQTLQNIRSIVESNPNVLSALMKFSGRTQEQIMDNLTYGSGPLVVIGQPKDQNGNPVIGQFNSSDPNTLTIDGAFINQLEHTTSESASAALEFWLSVTLMHEYVHYGDYMDGNPFVGEAGTAFENQVFGVVITQDNAGLLIDFFDKPK